MAIDTSPEHLLPDTLAGAEFSVELSRTFSASQHPDAEKARQQFIANWNSLSAVLKQERDKARAAGLPARDNPVYLEFYDGQQIILRDS
jgi:hypothetical protein